MSSDYPQIQASEAREFLRLYTDVFRDLLDAKYPTKKEEFPLYKGEPFQIFAFIVPAGVLVTYKTNAPSFSIKVENVTELPKERYSFTRFYTNRHFRAAMKNPQREAEQEINMQLSLESELREHEKAELEWLQQEWLEHIKSEVGDFLRYLADADEVQRASFEKNVIDLFDLLEHVARFQNRIEMFDEINAYSLILLYPQVLDGMHTSIFLAVHGKYAQAMSSMRQVLEVTLRGIESDYRIATQPETRPPDLEQWLQSKQLNFSGKGGVIERLLDDSTNRIVADFLREFRKVERTDGRDFIKKMYGELSRYVHVEGVSNRQIVLGFAEYDPKHFGEWRRTYAEVVLLIDLILLLKFPSLLAFSSKGERIGFPRFSAAELHFLQNELGKDRSVF